MFDAVDIYLVDGVNSGEVLMGRWVELGGQRELLLQQLPTGETLGAGVRRLKTADVAGQVVLHHAGVARHQGLGQHVVDEDVLGVGEVEGGGGVEEVGEVGDDVQLPSQLALL